MPKTHNPLSVIFVCLGNICRSPLAEAIFQNQINKIGLKQTVSCASAGTAHWHIGDQPDPRTLEIASDNHIPMSHRGRQIKPEDYPEYDYIIAMDHDNRNDILKSIPGNLKDRVFLMREFDNLRSGLDVPDPYYGEKEDFQLVFEILDESCRNFIDFLIEKHRLR